MATVTTDRRSMIIDRRSQEMQRNKIRMDTIERENRQPTAPEEAAISKSLTAIDQYDAQLAKLDADDSFEDDLNRAAGAEVASMERGALTTRRPQAGPMLSIGEQFIRSAVYEELKHTKSRGQGWRSAASSELHLYAATLTEDPASGGGLVTPTYRPGIVSLPTPPLTIADLFASGTTNSNAVVVMQEKTITNAAAAVLEGGVKPESSLVFEQKTEPVRKIATWVPASEEILEDVAGLRSYLDARLSLFVRLEEEDQLLNGNGTPPNLQGILARTGLAASIARVDPQTNADAIAAQIAAIQAATNLPASGIVMNPVNWQAILLEKTTAGEYLGDGPFREPNALSLWGVPVALSSLIAAGTALVGAFATGAQIFRRGGVVVQATNSHQDYFVKNLVAIRAEERLALAVYRPAAFGTVTGLE